MFRRSKPQHLAPAAPTIDQILVDLETFEAERAQLQPLRTLDPTPPQSPQSLSSDTASEATVPVHHSPESGSQQQPAQSVAANKSAQLDQWMRTFETFRTDCADLHRLRRQLNLCRTELMDAQQEIGSELAAVRQKVAEVVLS